MQETFGDKEDENEVAEEKKLVYMALTRARQKLFLSYVGQLPRQLRGITEFMDVI
jgi:superfamily I DNA/RNA helicase